MKTTLMTALAAALLALGAAPASAQGGGDSNPFLNPAAGTTTYTYAPTQVADVGSETLPSFADRPGSDLTRLADTLLPGNSSTALVQTANSLPQGFEQGTASYAYTQSIDRHFAAQAERTRVIYAARAEGGPSRTGGGAI